MTDAQKAVLTADAKNRAWRTFLQNAAWDVIAALVLLLFPLVSNATGWQDIDWKVMAFMVTKTALASFLAYCMRYFRKLDELAPPPDERGAAGVNWLVVIAVVLTAILLVLVFNIRAT